MSIHTYLDSLSKCLMAFQYLEASLKFYIRDCDRIIQKSVKESFHYSVREKEIEKMPLGRLINEFSRRSNRKDITSVLKKLNKHRNQMAHSAYLLNIKEQKDSDKLKEYSQTFLKIKKSVDACIKELVCENARITNIPVSKEILDQM